MKHLDFETRSKLDLKKCGAWAYAMHPSTEVLCIGWARSGGVPQVSSPKSVVAPLAEAEILSAHNAQFEYVIYNFILHKRYGWPARWDPKLWTCTLARAAQVGLPLDLDTLSRVLHCKTPKDLDGRRVMHQLCKPGADGNFDEDPKKLERLYTYNANDVRTEMEVDALLPELTPHERRVWELDLVMNRRGIQVDLEFAAKAAALSKAVVGPLNERLRVVTGGAVSKATQVQELKRYCAAQGVTVPTKYKDGESVESLDKVRMSEMLADPKLPPQVREAIEIRRQVSKTTSTAKYAKALEMACPDGRVRGALQYHGAHTGRWAGRLLQAHNFPKGHDKAGQDLAVDAIMNWPPQVFSALYGNKTMDALSDALRGLLVAAPGKKLTPADYNAIEARVLFWLAGEEGALASYRRGESPYVDMANYIYKRSDITKLRAPKEYDIGKRTVLGCGYGMGPAKFKESVYEETAKMGAPVVLSDELAKRAVGAYRELYDGVPRLWKDVEAAALNAVRNPGKAYPACGGRVLWAMSQDRRFLVCRLPSGRYLWYYKPAVNNGYKIFCKNPKCVHWEKFDEAYCPTRREINFLTYWGEHPKTGQWSALMPWGGTLVENIDQAISRDIMVNGMLNCEAADFPLVFTVHDEVVPEVGELRASFEAVQAELCRLPPWAEGLPVLAEGFVADRYRK